MLKAAAAWAYLSDPGAVSAKDWVSHTTKVMQIKVLKKNRLVRTFIFYNVLEKSLYKKAVWLLVLKVARFLGVVVVGAGSLLATPAYAQKQNPNAWLTLVSRVNSVTDIRSSDNQQAPEKFGTVYEVELGFRLRSYFQWIFVGYKTTDDLRHGYGSGFRVDTPGFFWMGGKDYLRVARRNYPVNTSIFATFNQAFKKDEVTEDTSMSFDSNMGIAIDIFLFNRHAFLTGQASMLNSNGNSFFVSGGGLGVEF